MFPLSIKLISKRGNTKGCEECKKIGSHWVNLRLCLTCGHVGYVILLQINMEQNIITIQNIQ